MVAQLKVTSTPVSTETDRGSGRFDIQSIPTPLVFTHIVTLIHRATGDEQSIKVETLSDSFCEVLREVAHQKVMKKLFGYEIFEAIPCDLPF